jgi:hypothetical protein
MPGQADPTFGMQYAGPYLRAMTPCFRALPAAERWLPRVAKTSGAAALAQNGDCP